MGSKQILIVEDEPAARESLKLLLELEGFEVRTAENGREAMAMVEQSGSPCLIVLDLMMPVMSGWEFLEALEAKRDTLTPYPNVIVVSAVADRGSRVTDRYAFLRKPFDVEPILEIANRCCDRAESSAG